MFQLRQYALRSAHKRASSHLLTIHHGRSTQPHLIPSPHIQPILLLQQQQSSLFHTTSTPFQQSSNDNNNNNTTTTTTTTTTKKTRQSTKKNKNNSDEDNMLSAEEDNVNNNNNKKLMSDKEAEDLYNMIDPAERQRMFSTEFDSHLDKQSSSSSSLQQQQTQQQQKNEVNDEEMEEEEEEEDSHHPITRHTIATIPSSTSATSATTTTRSSMTTPSATATIVTAQKGASVKRAVNSNPLFLFKTLADFVLSRCRSVSSRENMERLSFYFDRLLRSKSPKHVIQVLDLLSSRFRVTLKTARVAAHALRCGPSDNINDLSKYEKYRKAKMDMWPEAKILSQYLNMYTLNQRSYNKDEGCWMSKKPTLTIKQVHSGMVNVMGDILIGDRMVIISDLLRETVSNKEIESVFDCILNNSDLGVVITQSMLEQALAIALSNNAKLNANHVPYVNVSSGIAAKIQEGKSLAKILEEVLDCGTVDILVNKNAKTNKVLPMLAKSGQNIEKVLNVPSDIRLECKYDGNRVHIHYKCLRSRVSIEYFSRLHNNISDTLRPLDKYIIEAVNPDGALKSFTLDAEIYPFDEETKSPLPFQRLQPQISRLHEDPDAKMPVRIAVFDILRPEDLFMSLPLKERLERLDSVFKVPDTGDDSDKLVHRAYHRMVKGDLPLDDKLEIFQDELANCVGKKYEGLIIKYMDQSYTPSYRGWYKYKKDYAKSACDTLDLVCIGATQRENSSKWRSLILAAYNTVTRKYETVTRVSGVSISNELMEDLVQNYRIDGPQDNYDVRAPVIKSTKHWFKPSVLIEVSFMELSKSSTHTCGRAFDPIQRGISLRFPVFVKVRKDKPLSQANTAEDISQMFSGKNHETFAASKEET